MFSNRWIIRVLSMLLLAVSFTGCVSPLDGGQGEEQTVTTSFALSLKNVTSSQAPATKMSGSVVQASGVFRGIEQLYVVPFQTVQGTERGVAVKAGDQRISGHNVDLSNRGISIDGLIARNHAHLYEQVIIPHGMNRVLAYGKAIDESVSGSALAWKQHNGVLNPVGIDDLSVADDISFSLETIVSQADSTDLVRKADNLIAALNEIVTAIQETGEPALALIFQYSENQILACSYQTFYSILENLQTVIFNGYYGPGAQAIKTAIEGLSARIGEAGAGFPASYGVPEGIIGFWWNGKEFRKLINGVNIKLVSLGSFCFPPSLWYFANSPIQTSLEDSVLDEYKPDHPYWKNILSFYDDGGTVEYLTRSVAMSDSLQYGVGMLALNFSGNDADIVKDCPLTGIIVGNQRDVDFEFKPRTQAAGEEVPVRYVYDKIENGPLLGTATETALPTLLLQTAVGDSVHFALEFKNESGQTLSGQQGDILPGCRFYVVGKLNPLSLGSSAGQTPVICQDHMTTVTITVLGMDHAFNAIPDLYDPQLEVGILAEMDWIPITPQSIKLNL